MAGFTQARNDVTSSSGTFNDVRTGHSQSLLSPVTADSGHTRRLFRLSQSRLVPREDDAGHTRRLFDHGADRLTEGLHVGVPIPTGAFRRVLVWLEDLDGNPLDDAVWVQSAGVFPTAARVKTTADGRAYAQMWLLEVGYDQFQVIAQSDKPGVDYVWYESGNGEKIGPLTKESTLQFDPIHVGGFVAGNGIDFGGMF